MKYFRAVGWFILSLVVSCVNDAITKQVGMTCPPWQITFFRFLFGGLILLPIMLYQGKQAFITRRWGLHFMRGVLIFMAIGLWNQGVKVVPITTATIMSFSVPIFVLLLAPVLLKERIGWRMWVATVVGFVGIILMFQPTRGPWGLGIWFLLIAAGLFGLLDVLNKKYVSQESTLCMLFYSTWVAVVLVMYPALRVWRPISIDELLWLLALGIGNNLILYFLLRAFSLASAAVLAPFRYLEFFISMAVGYTFFNEVPSNASYLGAALIIPSAFFIGYYQMRHTKVDA